MKKFAMLAATAFVSLAALPAGAATLYSNPLLAGPTASPGSVSFSTNAAAGAGSLSFDIDGFASLDGVNYYEDDFSLLLNGTKILSLSYDLGGGGSNQVFVNSYGATINGGTFGFFKGGKLSIAIASLPLVAGSNMFTFAYDSLDAASGHAGAQGIGDEGWGISNVTLTGGAGVPEPATWGLMILGFGAAGGAMRRRQRAALRYAAA